MIAAYSEKIAKASARRALLQEEIGKRTAALQAGKARQEAIEQAQVIIQTAAQETQEQLRYHIQDLVQGALDTAFPGKYEFQIEFEIKRGRTEAKITLDSEGTRIDPMDSTGGGVVDIVAFSLRLAAWAISQQAPVITLDEPFKFLSVNLRPVAGKILRGLADRLGVQIIMVTHDAEMVEVADRVFEVDQKRRRSYIKAERNQEGKECQDAE